jgi:amino acid efflux transporter
MHPLLLQLKEHVMASAGYPTLRKHLTVADGFALYTTAVLGQSLIALPSIAARQAGPWSILIWLGLSVLSYPMARVMAELGVRYPSAGGVIAFIGAGLGKRAGELTGVFYLMAIAVAAPVAATFFSDYLGILLPLSATGKLWCAEAALMLPLVVNAFDVSALMRLQRWALIICLVAVGVSIACSWRHLSPARLTAVRGFTVPDILATSLLCFFAFIGWENASFAGEEFADRATLIKALRAAVVAVGALFVLLAVAVVGSLDRTVIAGSDASLSDLLQTSIGGAAAKVAAGIALLIMSLLMISWGRSASRLVFALARDGVLPAPLARVDGVSGAPRRALLALGIVETAGMVTYIVTNAHIDEYLRLSSANFVMTYILIFTAAWRLLEIRRFLAPLLISSLAILVLALTSAQHLGYAAASVVVYLVLLGWRIVRNRQRGRYGQQASIVP